MTPLQRFGHNLRQLREDLHLSQEELGFRTGLHRTEIGRLERFEREPRLQTLIKVAAGLEISLDDLCSGIDFDTKRLDFSVSASTATS